MPDQTENRSTKWMVIATLAIVVVVCGIVLISRKNNTNSTESASRPAGQGFTTKAVQKEMAAETPDLEPELIVEAAVNAATDAVTAAVTNGAETLEASVPELPPELPPKPASVVVAEQVEQPFAGSGSPPIVSSNSTLQPIVRPSPRALNGEPTTITRTQTVEISPAGPRRLSREP